MKEHLCRVTFGVLSVLVLAGGVSCVGATVDSRMNTVRKIRYAPDEGGDYWQTPEETIRLGQGDCEDQAFYLHRLLAGEGIASRVVFGLRVVTDGETGHAWVECEMHGRTYVLDPTCRMMTAREKLPPWKYFPILYQPELTRKFADYLARSGDRGVNPDYEAALAAQRARAATKAETQDSEPGDGRKELGTGN